MLIRVFPISASRNACLPSAADTSWSPIRHLASGRAISRPVSTGASSGSTQRFLVFFPFTAIQFPHANDAGFAITIAVNDRNHAPIQEANCYGALLAVVESRIEEAERRTREYDPAILKI